MISLVSNFYDDAVFMAALFYNDMLDNFDIFTIANKLTDSLNNDSLIQIVVNGKDNENNRNLLAAYFNKIKTNIKTPKQIIIAKIFFYILNGKLAFSDWIRFIIAEIVNQTESIEYVGDTLGMSNIIGHYYAIDDGDIKDVKEIAKTKEIIMKEMLAYSKNILGQYDERTRYV